MVFMQNYITTNLSLNNEIDKGLSLYESSLFFIKNLEVYIKMKNVLLADIKKLSLLANSL